ncbi:MAG TPA: radical SAM protein [Nitrososphaerales archaeon]|nr:radical SAM protein [Nitrososphaerales archaeon]
MKSIETPEGLLIFDRRTGLNVLFDELKKKDAIWQKPLYVALAITNRCNRECRWCYAASGPGFPVEGFWMRDRVLDLAKALDEYGVLGLALGGGEPFTYPRFANLCRDIWDSTGLDVGATTNGDLVTGEDLETLKGHFGQLRVSVWSEGEIGKAVKLLGRGVSIGINTLLFRGGFHQVDRIIRAGVAAGIEDFLILSCKPVGRANGVMTPTREDIDQLALLIRMYPSVAFEVDAAIAMELQGKSVMFAQPWIEEGGGSRFAMITHDGFVKPDSFSSHRVKLSSFGDFQSVYNHMRELVGAPLSSGLMENG